MKKTILFGLFSLFFMFAAIGNQGISFQIMGAPAFAGSDNESDDKGSKDSNSNEKSSKDSNSNENSVENETDDHADDDHGSDKTEVCHNETNTLSIDDDAVAAHIAHGDTMGECSEGEGEEVVASCDCPPGVACTCPDGTAGTTSGAPTAAGPSQYRSF